MPTKWYVNLPADMDRGDAKNHGPQVKIVAKRTGRSWTSTKKRKARWAVTWLPATHDAYFPSDPRWVRGVDVEEVKDRFVNELAVPPTGGITYTVTAVKAPNQGDANVNLRAEYEAWRLIYYKVNFMNNACRQLFESIEEDFKAAYAAAHIELEERGKREKCNGPDEPVTLRTGNLTLSAKHAGHLDRQPYHLRVVLVNDIAETKSKTLTVDVTRATATADVTVAGDRITVRTNKTASRIERGFAVKKLILKPDGAAVDVAPDQVVIAASGTSSELTTTMDTDTLRPLFNLAAAGKNVTITGTLSGRKVKDTDCRGNPTSANDRDHPIDVAHGRFWMDGTTVRFENTVDTHELHESVSCAIWVDKTRVELTVAEQSATTAAFSVPPKHVELVREALGSPKARVVLTVPLVARAEESQTVKVTVAATPQYTGGSGCGVALESMGRLKLTATDFRAGAVRELKLAGSETLNVGGIAKSAGLVTFADDGSELTIDASRPELAAVKAALDAGRSVNIDLEYEWICSFGGYHMTGTNVIVLTTIRLADDEPVETTRKRMLLVACHELGHALGLVRDTQATKAGPAEANALHYTGRGGQGPHCALHTKSVPADNAEGERFVPDDGVGALCVMYHTMAYLDRSKAAFCDVCLQHLTRNDVRIA